MDLYLVLLYSRFADYKWRPITEEIFLVRKIYLSLSKGTLE